MLLISEEGQIVSLKRVQRWLGVTARIMRVLFFETSGAVTRPINVCPIGATESESQQRIDEFKKAFESGAPPYNAPHEAMEKMHRATVELEASGIADRALTLGDRAPSFTLFNQDRVRVASNDLLREGPLVVSFFRGHW